MMNLELPVRIATPALAGSARESRPKIVRFDNPTEPHHLPERLGLSPPILLMYFGFVWDTLKS
jgi:hypothetical protein